MRKLMGIAALSLAAVVAVGCGKKEGGSPYVISDEKAPVKVKLARGGAAYAPAGESPTVAMFGTGGFRVDLQSKGGGVFESSPENPVPHGEYSVTVMSTKGRAVSNQTVARNVKVGPGENDFKFDVK